MEYVRLLRKETFEFGKDIHKLYYETIFKIDYNAIRDSHRLIRMLYERD